ncbi:unnamed protein product [Pedinophyceae sp. YPF-701]|nr:unnamed protein product [Pedinophyceae sp. YPF-701]
MSLRRVATQLAGRFGGFSQAESSVSIRAALERAFATVKPDCKYAPSHEWAKAEGDVVTVGISDFAQSELGDVVYVELPEVGDSLEASAPFGVVESVKAASDVYAPVSGEVVEVNSALSDDPSKVNSDAFGEGWMIKVKASDADGDLGKLMDSGAYEKHCDH